MKSVSEGNQIDNLNNVIQCKTVNCTEINKDALWSPDNSDQINNKIPYEIEISNYLSKQMFWIIINSAGTFSLNMTKALLRRG